MPKFKGRSITACYQCHRQKVRCNGEQPCQRCRARQKECIYSAKDPIVPVPESYLRHIDDSLNELKALLRSRSPRGSQLDVEQTDKTGRAPLDALAVTPAPVSRETDALVEDSTAESFIRKLRQTVESQQAPAGSGSSVFPTSPFTVSLSHQSPGSDQSARPHAVMRFDSLHSHLNYRLPPYAYAVELVSAAEQEFGDYHTFLRKSFWRRLHATYSDVSSQSHDRNWLCRLSLVLALAEVGTTRSLGGSSRGSREKDGPQAQHPSPSRDDRDWSPKASPALSSGVEFFEQGLVLLKVVYEEPTVDDVEALNLAAHCSYLLNRRRSAYAYAGQSVRLAQSLGLDRPPPSSLSNLEREHWKRVWWTAYCVDKSSSAELGLPSATSTDTYHSGSNPGPGMPDGSLLTAEEQQEFYNPDLLTAQIRVCELKSIVVETASRLKSKDIARPFEILGACLERLDQCREVLAPSCVGGGENAGGMIPPENQPERRIKSSISLRYNQCYILLLRPILIHQLTYLCRDDTAMRISDDIRAVNWTCLQAARSNMHILLELAHSGTLVKFGYWDSVHLFSCLMILGLANLLAARLPAAFQSDQQELAHDKTSYESGRAILTSMVVAGNVPSRHHLSMLEEVEAIGERMASAAAAKVSAVTTGMARTTNMDVMADTVAGPRVDGSGHGQPLAGGEMEFGFDHWGELFASSENFGVFDHFLGSWQ